MSRRHDHSSLRDKSNSASERSQSSTHWQRLEVREVMLKLTDYSSSLAAVRSVRFSPSRLFMICLA